MDGSHSQKPGHYAHLRGPRSINTHGAPPPLARGPLQPHERANAPAHPQHIASPVMYATTATRNAQSQTPGGTCLRGSGPQSVRGLL